jgi:hypothetical protein
VGEPSARSLYAVFSSPLPGREADYQRWYDEIHIPDSLALGVFRSARRYAALVPARAAYLTLWESDDPDPRAALERVRPAAERLRAQGRVWPVLRVVFHQFLFLVDFALAPSPPPAVATLTTLQNCWAAPASEAAFRAWWERLTREAGGPLAAYHSRRLYRGGGEAGQGGQALVLLESARESAELAGLWDGRAEAGPPPFGTPTPVFRGESPQQYAEPEPVSAAQLARWRPAWAAHWRPLTCRGAR